MVLLLAAVELALMLAVAVVGIIVDLSWGRILSLAALVWLAGPVVAVLLGGAAGRRLSATSASAARTAAGGCVEVRGGPPPQSSPVLTDAYGAAGR